MQPFTRHHFRAPAKTMTAIRTTCTIQPASNLGPLSAEQLNAIWMAFRCRADSGSI